MLFLELERWTTLLTQIVVTPELTDGLLCPNQEELTNFQSRLNFEMPIGYMEFCNVFGQGCFNNGWICIDCPSMQDLEGQFISNSDILNATKALYKNSISVQRLLSSAYLIGLGSGTLFVFDLSTYSNSDKSCDICAVDDEGDIYILGRDFFEFIRNFCMGRQFQEQNPSLLKSMGWPENFNESEFYSRTTFTPTFYITS